MKAFTSVAIVCLTVSTASLAALNKDEEVPRYVFTYQLNKPTSYMEYQYLLVKQDIDDNLEQDIDDQVMGALALQAMVSNPPLAGTLPTEETEQQ